MVWLSHKRCAAPYCPGRAHFVQVIRDGTIRVSESESLPIFVHSQGVMGVTQCWSTSRAVHGAATTAYIKWLDHIGRAQGADENMWSSIPRAQAVVIASCSPCNADTKICLED